MKEPRIGCVKYLNARPLIQGWPGEVEFDHPSALCRKLARGELDVALVSSIEYLRRPDYRIVDGVSIAAFGPVYSVFVAYDEELANVREIEIDPASETSVSLLRCLLAYQRSSAVLLASAGCQPAVPGSLPGTVVAMRRAVASGIRQAAECYGPAARAPQGRFAQLLIGDQAIRFRQSHPEYAFWDLAEQWKKVTALPFVFALWLVQRGFSNAEAIAEELRSLRDKNLARIDEVIASQTEYDVNFCRRYFCENLRFDFDEQEKAGLREFHRRCLASGIDVAPEIKLNLV